MATAQEYLRLIRETPMTQEEVSRRTGIPQPTISKIERGQRNVLATTYLALKALHDELHPPEPSPAPTPAGGWNGKDRRKEARA